MPLTLCEFLVSDASWDARLCAWLLYIVKKYSHQTDGLWSAYIKTLPKMSDLNLLLTFSPMEQMLLKIPWCVLAPLWIDSTAVVMCAHVHGARATLHAHLASTIHSTADRLYQEVSPISSQGSSRHCCIVAHLRLIHSQNASAHAKACTCKFNLMPSHIRHVSVQLQKDGSDWAGFRGAFTLRLLLWAGR